MYTRINKLGLLILAVLCSIYIILNVSKFRSKSHKRFIIEPAYRIQQNMENETGILQLNLSINLSEAEHVNPQTNIDVYIYNRPTPGWMDDRPFDKCKSKCRLLFTRWQKTPQNAVVLFHIPTLRGSPPPKRKGHVWVFYNQEAPPISPRMLHLWKGLFNWTIHYRRDSDFYMPYGGFKKKASVLRVRPPSPLSLMKWKNRERTIAWFVGNCKTQSKREIYVSLLQTYINIDKYGKCWPRQCGSKCNDILGKRYNFYLSFENAFCKDYITEKSYKVYGTSKTIPIVRGFQSMYKIFLPPKSYISTESYANTSALATVLRKNLTYNESEKYFEWVKSYDLLTVNNKMCSV